MTDAQPAALPTTRLAILAELERRHPESADLLTNLRRVCRGGRPRAEPLTNDEKDKAIQRIIMRRIERGPGFPTRTELLQAIHNTGSADDLEANLIALQMQGKIEEQQDRTRRGRPCTTYGPASGED